MEQTTINQRLKFLLETFGLSARAFSEQIGESPTNTQNYVGTRGAEPRAAYLQNVLRHFNSINAQWLMTGEGEPFLPTEAGATTNINNSKNKGTVQNNTGNHNTINNNVTLDECKRELAASQKDNEHLREQLKLKDALIAAKDQTITLLQASYNRPN